MTELGYALSSEEHAPGELVRNAARAEEAGFTFALISDHIHPWVDAQGHSAFVWSEIGAIAQATERLKLGTGVTCPMIRIHPAIVAHAAATCTVLMEGRFFLGVGSGENLNEHVTGAKWPAPDERLEMLEEAVQVVRLLWKGGYRTHRGKHYIVEHTRIFDLPDEPIELAGRIGDSFVNVTPDEQLVAKFDAGGATGRNKYGQVTGCFAKTEDEARNKVAEVGPNALVEGAASQELPYPEHFEQVAEAGDPADLELPLGPDPEPWVEQIEAFEQAGFTHVYLHQIGRDQDAFFEFAKRELIAR